MSYTEYLRRKAAAAPVIIDPSPRKVEASQFTSMTRMKANSVFFTSTRVGSITNVMDPASSNNNQIMSYTKTAGGKIPDSSHYTSFLGGNAIREDTISGNSASKFLLNSNGAGSLSACTAIADPTPFVSGTFAPNNVPMTGSGFLNNTKHCKDIGRVEPHIASELGPTLFVDNTIRDPAYMAKLTMQSNPTVCPPANHTHPADKPHNQYQARPKYAEKGIPNGSMDMPYVIGNVVPSKHLKYVERKHGNDLMTMVNGRKPVPTKFQIPAGTPAHLKINDPIGPRGPPA